MNVYRIKGAPADSVLYAAAGCIRAGGTLIFPTDTVYGIGCDPENRSAVDAIFAAKCRPFDKPLAVHIATPDAAVPFARKLTEAARAVMATFWPGPVAIIVERRAGRAGAATHDGPTISLRCPDDDVCRAVLLACGPIAATSANISGLPAFRGDGDEERLPEASMAIIAGPTRQRQESTVLDCSGRDVIVLRKGPITPEALSSALAGVATVVVGNG